MRTVEENYEGVVIGRRRITHLRYADASTQLTQERIRKFFKDLVKGGGALCAGNAVALLVFGPVMP